MTSPPEPSTDSELEVSVVAPVFEEAENLHPLHEQLTAALAGRRFEVIYVDDGSRDASFRVLQEIAASDPRAVVLRFRRNYGQTAAIAAGIDHARGRVIVPIDADLQNDPGDIPMLLAKLDEGFDVVSGWRKDRKDAALSRVLPSMIANFMISRISGVKLHDYGCMMKAYRREVIEDVRLYGEMHRFIPAFASFHGARVVEVPVRHHPRTRGHSKYGLGRTFRVLLDMIVVKFLAKYSTKPMHVFGGFGLLCFAAAFVCGAVALWFKLPGEPHKDLIQTPLPLLGVVLAVLGCMSILMGLLAELVVRTYYESSDRKTYVLADASAAAPRARRGPESGA